MRIKVAAGLALAGVFSASLSSGADAPTRATPRSPEADGPSLGFTMLAGATAPLCSDQACSGAANVAPSFRALALYRPNSYGAFGLVGQMASVDWRASYSTLLPGPSRSIEATLMTGFGGLVGQVAPFPNWALTPIIEMGAGVAFQTQSISNFNCNGGPAPAVDLGVGASSHVAPSLSVFVMASALMAFRGTSCGVSDGPPATPNVMSQYGLHAGMSFDVALH